jgi:hypothetical protein
MRRTPDWRIVAVTFALATAGALASAARAAAPAPHGAGSGSSVAPAGPAEEILRQARDYRSWRKFASYEAAAKPSKAHSGNHVVAWYNDAAAPAVKGGAKVFPDGSVIVKENRLTADGKPASLSVMAKRAGAWFWISATPDWKVFTAGGKPLAGDLGSCAGCHGEAPKDAVYSE